VDNVIEVRDGYLLARIGRAWASTSTTRHRQAPPVSIDLSDPPLREDGSVAIR